MLNQKIYDNLNEIADIASLKKVVESRQFLQCSAIQKTANNTVFADGNAANSPLLLIGEAPGYYEDKYGVPFCGKSGKLLDLMLKEAGIGRCNCYITNAVFWRPPNNRRPTDLEIEECRPFLERHIRLVKPRCIILLGKTAAESVLRVLPEEKMHYLMNKKFYYKQSYNFSEQKKIPESFRNDCESGGNNRDDGRSAELGIRVFVLFHPSYILRNPQMKDYMVKRLKKIGEFYSK